LTTLVAVLGGAGPAAGGKADQQTGDQLIEEMIERDPLGYGGAEARIVMALVNNRNQVQKRKVVMFSRKDGKTRRLFLRFLSPSDVAGTAFLGIDDDGDRVQHLFLPASAKTRRISSRQRNASFVGTDYSYSDLDFRDIDDAVKRRLADEAVGDQPAYVVEVEPSSAESKYGRVTVWIGKKTMLPLRIRYYDRGGSEIKRLTVQEVKKVDDRWIIGESKMVDLKREHTTVFKVVEIALKKDIDLDQFSVRALERG
jgi:hypothetical protein